MNVAGVVTLKTKQHMIKIIFKILHTSSTWFLIAVLAVFKYTGTQLIDAHQLKLSHLRHVTEKVTLQSSHKHCQQVPIVNHVTICQFQLLHVKSAHKDSMQYSLMSYYSGGCQKIEILLHSEFQLNVLNFTAYLLTKLKLCHKDISNCW